MTKYTQALFLDRDGVLNIDTGYLHKPKEWVWNEGIFEILRFFKQKDFLLLLITNQSGIHRNYFSFADFSILSAFMQNSLLEKLGFCLDKIYFCPHTPQETCVCRKPKTGMIKEALRDFPALRLSESVLIGDSWTDILVARKMDMKQSYWLTQNPQEQDLLENEQIISKLTEIIS